MFTEVYELKNDVTYTDAYEDSFIIITLFQEATHLTTRQSSMRASISKTYVPQDAGSIKPIPSCKYVCRSDEYNTKITINSDAIFTESWTYNPR